MCDRPVRSHRDGDAAIERLEIGPWSLPSDEVRRRRSLRVPAKTGRTAWLYRAAVDACATIVPVRESADLGNGDHSALSRWHRRSWFGRVLLEREMRTRRRLVADVRLYDRSETGSVQHDDMVEALAAN